MQLCYIDESGTPDIPGNTSHYILAGLSVPDQFWQAHHRQLEAIKARYVLADEEIHVAWMMRPYVEQQAIAGFEAMPYHQRRSEVSRARTAELLRVQKQNNKRYKQVKKNYRQTDAYVHLTLTERQGLVKELASLIASWGVVRLFAECIDKVHFDPTRTGQTVHEQAFEQVVSRFERYLQNLSSEFGLLIHDNNPTYAKRHTELMRTFLQRGTLWTAVERVIETPLFVDSQLTGMVQLADLCAYALRRYLENGETELFELIFSRADRLRNTVVGVRHFTGTDCTCVICSAHRTTGYLGEHPESPSQLI